MLTQLLPLILPPLTEVETERTYFAAALIRGNNFDAIAGGIGDTQLRRYIELQQRDFDHHRAVADMQQDLEYYIGTRSIKALTPDHPSSS